MSTLKLICIPNSLQYFHFKSPFVGYKGTSAIKARSSQCPDCQQLMSLTYYQKCPVCCHCIVPNSTSTPSEVNLLGQEVHKFSNLAFNAGSESYSKHWLKDRAHLSSGCQCTLQFLHSSFYSNSLFPTQITRTRQLLSSGGFPPKQSMVILTQTTSYIKIPLKYKRQTPRYLKSFI